MRKVRWLMGLVLLGVCGVSLRPAGAVIDATNVDDLVPRWTFETPSGVTGALLLANGLLYVPTWGSQIYALDPVTGATVWSANTGGAVAGGILHTADDGLCFGTLTGTVGCIEASDGSTRWATSIVEPDVEGIAVWSAPSTANGRLFVGVASINDALGCSRGRVLALDLDTGTELWRYYTVPAKVCTDDTDIECDTDDDCFEGTCVVGRGGGVTATPLPDPTGEFVYMNSVGCYTFPSIGLSDAMFKLNAATGDEIWNTRVSNPEQFGACASDPSTDCGVDDDCGIGDTCEEKPFWHDFGFLNGPLRIATGTVGPQIVSGSKNGTLYAFDEDDGSILWENAVVPEPVSPGFAGWGLFNGAIFFDGTRIYAALHSVAPSRVCSNAPGTACSSDGQCPGGTCLTEPEHLMAFDPADGQTLWSAEIGRSWSHVAVANGVVYAGTETEDEGGLLNLYAHDAATGERLATFALPSSNVSRTAVDATGIYVGFGALSAGGVRALGLCSNGVLDAGEECDDGNIVAGDCCSPTCGVEAAGSSCDDADACTAADQCAAGVCGGVVNTTELLSCALDALEASPCGAEAIPAGLTRQIAKAVASIEKLIAKAVALAAKGKTKPAEAARARALKRVDALAKKIAKAASSTKPAKQISAECKAALDGLVESRRAMIDAFPLE